nr:hypothetical protein GCM10020092_042130 [Actinoplanes digitatis]
MSNAPILLEMRSITKEFPGVKALSDVNLVVRVGEIHAICGENGAEQVHADEGTQRRLSLRVIRR